MEPDIRRLGRYRIVAELGRGGLGPVYKAFDVSIERFVAIKTIRKDLIFDWRGTQEFARFRGEAQAAGKLFHPNIVAVYEYGEEKSLAYLAMELIEGRTFATIFKRNEPVPVATAVDYVAQLLTGLSHAHSRGVVHGGICSREVVIGDEQVVKLKGFWAPKVDGVELTADKVALDQAAYLAPEQFLGNRAEIRTDIYSAGAVFYHLLTGRAPYRGVFRALRFDVLANDPPPPSEINRQVPVALDEIVLKAMAKKPEDRFASAEEFGAAIRAALLEVMPATQRPVEAAPSAGKKPLVRRALVTGEVLFNDGDPGDHAFIVESGIMQIYKPADSGEAIVLATVGRGEIIGEMALVDNQPRMAAARALEETVLVVVPREDFQNRLERIDKVTHKLIGVLVNRCRGLADEVKSLKTLVDKR